MRARWPQTLFYGALPLRAMGYDNYCEACAALAAQAKSMAPHRHECRIACFFASDAPTAVVLVQAGLFMRRPFSHYGKRYHDRLGARLWQMVHWDLATGQMRRGQWCKLHLALDQCFLSPDGEHFSYTGGKMRSSSRFFADYQRLHGINPFYTVVCRPPFWSAVALFDQRQDGWAGDRFGGGEPHYADLRSAQVYSSLLATAPRATHTHRRALACCSRPLVPATRWRWCVRALTGDRARTSYWAPSTAPALRSRASTSAGSLDGRPRPSWRRRVAPSLTASPSRRTTRASAACGVPGRPRSSSGLPTRRRISRAISTGLQASLRPGRGKRSSSDCRRRLMSRGASRAPDGASSRAAASCSSCSHPPLRRAPHAPAESPTFATTSSRSSRRHRGPRAGHASRRERAPVAMLESQWL